MRNIYVGKRNALKRQTYKTKTAENNPECIFVNVRKNGEKDCEISVDCGLRKTRKVSQTNFEANSQQQAKKRKRQM